VVVLGAAKSIHQASGFSFSYLILQLSYWHGLLCSTFLLVSMVGGLVAATGPAMMETAPAALATWSAAIGPATAIWLAATGPAVVARQA
jgi:hypothetical protein